MLLCPRFFCGFLPHSTRRVCGWYLLESRELFPVEKPQQKCSLPIRERFSREGRSVLRPYKFQELFVAEGD